MKKILSLTDFSECAEIGLEAAAKFAKHFGSEVLIFTNLNIPYNWDKLSKEERSLFPQAIEEIDSAKSKLAGIKEKFSAQGLKVRVLFSGGKLIDNVREIAAAENVDLIILGSHGASGFQELFIGSNTQRIVRLVHSPVLVVKNPLKKLDFRNIVYASDFNTKDQKAFLRFLLLVKSFKPTIHLLAIDTPGFFAEPRMLTESLIEEYKEICGDLKCESHIVPNLIIDAGIREFSKKIKADLIVVTNQHRNPIRRIFAGSNVEALINHSDIPVMSLDFNP